MERWIKGSLPSLLNPYRRAREVISTLLGFTYDAFRYIRNSSPRWAPKNSAQFEAIVTMEYHAIEKGMALKAPRPGFGKARIKELTRLIRQDAPKYSWDGAAAHAVNALSEYEEVIGKNPDISALLDDAPLIGSGGGGTQTVTRSELQGKAVIDLRQFFDSRHSIRHFSEAEVDTDLIERAVLMAMKTPSVCNRQAWRVHVLSDPKDKALALKHQNGNAGFGGQADKLLIVTCDLRRFTTAGERFQPWIDGGMFSMSLIYALHSLGLGTCSLNMSTPAKRDRAFRNEMSLPSYEAVIMLVAVGHLPEEFKVAQSPKRILSEIISLR